ncbi:MAG TPA: hypothetical protein VHX65_10745 [Pirellulales bacterium]|jgi:hypothetical protein|nr:hypothetical protein [Pirellulales bacterium]
MIARFIRALRTASSERFILQAKEGQDAAVLDLHYTATGNIAGTLILLEHGGISEAMVPDLLQEIDEVLLPEVTIDHRKVSFTAVIGRVVGHFAPHGPVEGGN